MVLSSLGKTAATQIEESRTPLSLIRSAPTPGSETTQPESKDRSALSAESQGAGPNDELARRLKEYQQAQKFGQTPVTQTARAELNRAYQEAKKGGSQLHPSLEDSVRKALFPEQKAGPGGAGQELGGLLGGLSGNFSPAALPESGQDSAPAEAEAQDEAQDEAPEAPDPQPAGEVASSPEASESAQPESPPQAESPPEAAQGAEPPPESAEAPSETNGAPAEPDLQETSSETPPADSTEETSPNKELDEANQAEQNRASDPFYDSRSQLTEAFRGSNALDQQSMERLGRIMTQFEGRMAGLTATKIAAYQREHSGPVPPEISQQILAESQQKINDTYRHLTENVGTQRGPNELFGQADRASMSENLLFHLADPTNYDQGSNGTCWINSSTASYGMANQPDDMARFMKEISLTGQFQAHPDGMGNGERTIQFNENMFYRGSQESNWKINNALQGSARSPVGMFMDEAMTEMVGKHQASSGSFEGGWGAKRIMTMITGEAPPDPRGRLGGYRSNRQMDQGDLQTLYQNGGFQIYSPGHLQSVQFLTEGKYAFQGPNGMTLDGNPMKLDGSDPLNGFIVLDNQWGESNDFITHQVSNGNIQDIQDQRYAHYDAGKVDNERNITIRPGNDSNGGGGWGGGGGNPFIDGGGVPFLNSLLPLIGSLGGNADPKQLTQAGGWANIMNQLTAMAEKEVRAGKPGVAFDKLSLAVRKHKVGAVTNPDTLVRMKKVLTQGERIRRAQRYLQRRPHAQGPVRRPR